VKYIELHNKKYRAADDVPYNIAKEFKNIQKRFATGDLEEDLDELLIKLLTTNICPSLIVNFEDMSIDGVMLTFGDVKNLVIDLRDIFEEIINKQLETALRRSNDRIANKIGNAELKNGEEVTME